MNRPLIWSLPNPRLSTVAKSPWGPLLLIQLLKFWKPKTLNESLSQTINGKKAHFIPIKSNYELCPKISVDSSTLLMQKTFQIVSETKNSNFASAGAHLSPDYRTNFKCAKGSKSSHAPKILKHYMRKQTSFNNIWTALLTSELNGHVTIKFLLWILFGFIPSSTPFLIKTRIFWKYTALKFRPLNASLGQ